MKNIKGWTLVKYEEPAYASVDGIYIPSGEEQDRHFKKKDRRSVSWEDKPKDMYRWGVVESSGVLKKGDKAYYSKYDMEEFKHNGETYNAVPDKLVIATMV